jgi:hypothetical protein
MKSFGMRVAAKIMPTRRRFALPTNLESTIMAERSEMPGISAQVKAHNEWYAKQQAEKYEAMDIVAKAGLDPVVWRCLVNNNIAKTDSYQGTIPEYLKSKFEMKERLKCVEIPEGEEYDRAVLATRCGLQRYLRGFGVFTLSGPREDDETVFMTNAEQKTLFEKFAAELQVAV